MVLLSFDSQNRAKPWQLNSFTSMLLWCLQKGDGIRKPFYDLLSIFRRWNLECIQNLDSWDTSFTRVNLICIKCCVLSLDGSWKAKSAERNLIKNGCSALKVSPCSETSSKQDPYWILCSKAIVQKTDTHLFCIPAFSQYNAQRGKWTDELSYWPHTTQMQ